MAETGDRRSGGGGEQLLLVSLFCTYLGSAITTTATTIFLVQKFGVGVSTGTALVLQLVPNLVLGPVAGEIVTRTNPKHAAVTSSVATGVAVLGYLLVEQVWQAQVLAFVIGLVGVIGIPARMALRSAVLTPERLKSTTGGIVAAERLGLVLGPLAASAAAVAAGVQAAFVLEFLLALAGSVALLRLIPRHADRGAPTSDGLRGVYRRAWQLMSSSRLLWEYSLTGFTYSIGIGIRRLLFPAALVVALASTEDRLGLLIGALALGGFAGGLLAPRVSSSMVDRHYLWQSAVEVVLWLLLGMVTSMPTYVFVVFVAGVLEGSTTALYFMRVQALLAPREIGRYFSLMSPMSDASIAVGVLIASSIGLKRLTEGGPLLIAVFIGIPFVACPALVRGALRRPSSE